MFGFNPGNEDRSGEIIGQGVVGAANTTAQANVQFADSIGSSLVSLAAAYGAKKGTEAKGKNFKKFMGMAGDTFGMDGAMFADMEDYDAGMMLQDFAPMMPAMANAQLFSQRNMTALSGQQIQAGMPARRARIDTQSTIAGGGGTVPLQDDPMGYAPSAPPGTGATQAASAWYNQSRAPTSMAGGGMKPFWK